MYISDNDVDWEAKHVWALVDDPPSQLRCYACHLGTIECKYFRKGLCFRGASCAYKHADAEGDGSRAMSSSSFLEASDLHAVSAVSKSHYSLVPMIGF